MTFVWHKFDEPTNEAGCQPVGRLLRSEGGTVLLVGDVNEIMGMCDDCCDRTAWVEFCDDLIPLVEKASRPNNANR